MTLSAEIKNAIRQSGIPVAQIARESGIPQPTLSRFLSDDPAQHRDIRLEATADRLAEYLGIKVQAKKAAVAKKRSDSK